MSNNEFGTKTEQEIRDKALEEAAKLCENYEEWADTWGEHKNMVAVQICSSECAEKIRRLKDNYNAQ